MRQRMIVGVWLLSFALGACASDQPALVGPTPASPPESPAPPPSVEPSPDPARPVILRFDGIGPLMVGMTEEQAEATGWVSDRVAPWCALFEGEPEPDPSYSLDGPEAPSDLDGSVMFFDGALDHIVIRAGAQTAAGIGVGVSTLADLESAYTPEGLTVDAYSRFEDYNDFATVDDLETTRLMVALGPDSSISLMAAPVLRVCD